jgi:porin
MCGRLTLAGAIGVIALLGSGSVSAEEAPVPRTDTLRERLAAKGIEVEASYTFDIVANVSGGLKRGSTVLDNTLIGATFDGDKLFGWSGGSVFVQALSNQGGHPDRDLVGSAQGVDNIEVGQTTAKLYQAWVQQNMFDDKVSVLAGLYDLNSEFYVTQTSGLFMHSTYGIGTDFAQSGENGPSIFPNTALGMRVKVAPSTNSYVQFVALDAVAGDLTNPRGTQIDLDKGDGTLWVGEAGMSSGANGKLAIGAWHYSNATPDPFDPAKTRHNQGYYALGEHKIWSEAGSDSQGISIFGRIGVADSRLNQFATAWSVGFVYEGLIPGRDDGQFGIGLSSARHSGAFLQGSQDDGQVLDKAETALEFTYRDTLTPWITVQPNLQLIINPSTDPSLKNAVVIGVRTSLSF